MFMIPANHDDHPKARQRGLKDLFVPTVHWHIDRSENNTKWHQTDGSTWLMIQTWQWESNQDLLDPSCHWPSSQLPSLLASCSATSISKNWRKGIAHSYAGSLLPCSSRQRRSIFSDSYRRSVSSTQNDIRTNNYKPIELVAWRTSQYHPKAGNQDLFDPSFIVVG